MICELKTIVRRSAGKGAERYFTGAECLGIRAVWPDRLAQCDRTVPMGVYIRRFARKSLYLLVRTFIAGGLGDSFASREPGQSEKCPTPPTQLFISPIDYSQSRILRFLEFCWLLAPGCS